MPGTLAFRASIGFEAKRADVRPNLILDGLHQRSAPFLPGLFLIQWSKSSKVWLNSKPDSPPVPLPTWDLSHQSTL